jgi:hypothetical protein
MKKSRQANKQSGNHATTAKAVQAPRGRWPLPRWLVLGVCLLVACGGTWVFFEFVLWNKIPSALVGKWVVVEGPQEGATFDFFRSGTLIGKVNLGGKEGVINARIRLEEKKLFSTTTHPITGKDDTHVQIIRTLTPKDLVLEDEQGQLLKMERAE